MRTPLVVLGAFISILGYAVLVNGLSNLTGIFGGPVGILQGLVPASTLGGKGATSGTGAAPTPTGGPNPTGSTGNPLHPSGTGGHGKKPQPMKKHPIGGGKKH